MVRVLPSKWGGIRLDQISKFSLREWNFIHLLTYTALPLECAVCLPSDENLSIAKEIRRLFPDDGKNKLMYCHQINGSTEAAAIRTCPPETASSSCHIQKTSKETKPFIPSWISHFQNLLMGWEREVKRASISLWCGSRKGESRWRNPNNCPAPWDTQKPKTLLGHNQKMDSWKEPERYQVLSRWWDLHTIIFLE